ncbi:MAG: hypothetical protein A2X86_21015 [Bdellovibrionales bacterium GWA2_49_15]|nr:MAG: hypothetical protein A2X86_21015 [Bdellovibrionales bacterium GWA2_49_15]HAZ14860.1 hypothetical protein [Bdellovibrionales bacterium]
MNQRRFRGVLGIMLGQERGQTAVEYILMLVVLAAIIIPITKKIREHFLNDDGTCTQVNKSVICFFKRGLSANYKTYKVP